MDIKTGKKIMVVFSIKLLNKWRMYTDWLDLLKRYKSACRIPCLYALDIETEHGVTQFWAICNLEKLDYLKSKGVESEISHPELDWIRTQYQFKYMRNEPDETYEDLVKELKEQVPDYDDLERLFQEIIDYREELVHVFGHLY